VHFANNVIVEDEESDNGSYEVDGPDNGSYEVDGPDNGSYEVDGPENSQIHLWEYEDTTSTCNGKNVLVRVILNFKTSFNCLFLFLWGSMILKYIFMIRSISHILILLFSSPYFAKYKTNTHLASTNSANIIVIYLGVSHRLIVKLITTLTKVCVYSL
jgi:hypothetical protein